MKNIEDKTLVEMASGGFPDDEYYTKALQKVSQNKERSWNWCAALFCSYWMLYHKMFKEFYILGLIGTIWAAISLTIVLIFPNFEFVNLISTFSYIIYFVLCGLYGNKFLFNSLKRKINLGYLLIPKYKTTDGAFVFLSLILIPICYALLLIIGIVDFKRTDLGFYLLFLISIMAYIVSKMIIFPIRDRIRAASYKKAFQENKT